ncbi:protein kinase domain-containing protein [Truepera radiovictrix]|uniref:non-specific serine/threonine protein kinase n=1 Tax=Truepera radiovictrix (strain DSM 17093 / CIP 108686 / LMG 22925 / RQ-24) TaxID=649638 RepID=D7CSV8_TRURR|nr:serine/threonine-protein kinase [Truepera radiovictrix]ADI13725.1 serine/threonine protein kinase [Truepera radiovictrix DSM 17093]WMT57710.1 protein kinase [Truepera radiovictrix]
MSRFSVGELIDGRFEITGSLGHGGMAQVYRALDRHLEREVALKVLRPHLTEADSERFRREVMTLAKLAHPNIVSIFDLGRGEHIYFTMELVSGGAFTDLGPLTGDLEPLLDFLDAAIAVADALAYVHRLGMVHRDLTPRNILLTPSGQPKVMDFGLVQLAEASRQLTRTGLTLGTPQYMAPEQAQGGATGAHTDLYALGAVLYKTVTGEAPFEAENDLTLLYKHVYSDLVPPEALNPELPPSLARLIESLLAKRPEERPASGERVADALRTVRAEVARRSLTQRLGGPGQRGVLAEGPLHPVRLTRRWHLKLPEGPQWPAALTAADGFVLLGTRSEEVIVLHPTDGSVQGRFAADDEVNSAVVWCEEHLAYTSRAGALSLHRWPSGDLAWTDEGAGAVGLLPYAGELLLTTQSGLERRTLSGEVRWRYPSDEAATAPTAVAGGVFFTTRSGWLHCVDARDGSGRFKLHLGETVAQCAATPEVLLLPERSGDLHAFDLQRLEVRWSYDMEGPLWASPLLWGRLVYCASWAGVMRCLALETGDDLWEADLGARVTAAPVLASGVLYVATEAGELVALDARTGARLFSDQVAPSPIQASPLVLGETLLVAALDGTVRAYR